MANKIQLKRGLKSRLSTLSAGEPAYTTDTRELFVGTGSGNVNMGGSQWLTGTAMSGTSTSTSYYYSSCPNVKLGDMYLNTTYGYIYQCITAGSGSTARWTYKGCIKGEDGKTVVSSDAISNSVFFDVLEGLFPEEKIITADIDVQNHTLTTRGDQALVGEVYFANRAGDSYNAVSGVDDYFLYTKEGYDAEVPKGKRAVIRCEENARAVLVCCEI